MDKPTSLKPVIDVARFSSWTKLLRATARKLQLKTLLPLSVASIFISKLLMKHVTTCYVLQYYFGNDTANIANNHHLPTRKNLLQLCAFSHNNLLCVSGKTKRNSLTFSTMHSIFFSAKNFLFTQAPWKLHAIWSRTHQKFCSADLLYFLAFEMLYEALHWAYSFVDILQVETSNLQRRNYLPSDSHRPKYLSPFLSLISITLDCLLSCGKGKNQGLTFACLTAS